ncbi:IS5/IS1182 family transposase, partial [Streptococcus agalactiae]|nr:IS5/IS1182 family transposase [Streptococcus agalactiae]
SKIMAGIVFLVCLKVIISRPIVITIVKEKTSWINIPVCLQSEVRQLPNLFWTKKVKLIDQLH